MEHKIGKKGQEISLMVKLIIAAVCILLCGFIAYVTIKKISGDSLPF